MGFVLDFKLTLTCSLKVCQITIVSANPADLLLD
jgi:hypothetical protein